VHFGDSFRLPAFDSNRSSCCGAAGCDRNLVFQKYRTNVRGYYLMTSASLDLNMNSDIAISIENLGKCYDVDRLRDPNDGLRHVIENALRSPFRALRGRFEAKRTRKFWALRGVSLNINRGEVVGIIGRNGAGKSTMLKLFSRITMPTEGRIRINGSVASLLEVGTGFHQELTGRENIFLNGAVLGMKRAEIKKKFDEIVEFSEVGEFLDTPVKRYSSGMYVRLAFAVAAHLDPEILIVDEVLAVGDAGFQRKCLGKMSSFAQSGRTVLFVSHNMEAVRNLCQRVVWLKDGRVERDGPAEEVVEQYFNTLSNSSKFSSENEHFGFAIRGVSLRNSAGKESAQFSPGDDLTVEIDYSAEKPIDEPYIILSVNSMTGSCFTANMLLDGNRPKVLQGNGKIACRFRSIPIFPQSYSVKMSIRTKNGNDRILDYTDVAFFNVVGNLADYGFEGEFVSRSSSSTPVVVPYEWHLPDGTVTNVSLTPKAVSAGLSETPQCL
jgi:lipopolysaccharide transport system ATP-binding protein